MRIVVTGQKGQIVTALLEVAASDPRIIILPLARPQLDLTRLSDIASILDAAAPDLVINAAAYTAVDKAESDPDMALLVNGAAAGAVAAACARRHVPVIQLSTDFVFDGEAKAPYREDAATAPLNVYGASKLLGEQLVAASNPRHLIVRTSWVISPFGHNFAATMLRLGAERASVSVVDDQHAAPTYAPDAATALLALAQTMAQSSIDDPRWGIYHLTNQGSTTWCGLAREIFRCAAAGGAPVPAVAAIPTSGYPTPARRPKNSRLDTQKLATIFDIVLPPWQQGVAACVGRLLAKTAAKGSFS